jgi:hypothetical protein
VTIYLDESSILVHPDAASRQIKAESEQPTIDHPPSVGGKVGFGKGENGGANVDGPDSGGTVDSQPIQAPGRELSRSLHGIVEIDPARLGGSAGAIS